MTKRDFGAQPRPIIGRYEVNHCRDKIYYRFTRFMKLDGRSEKNFQRVDKEEDTLYEE